MNPRGDIAGQAHGIVYPTRACNVLSRHDLSLRCAVIVPLVDGIQPWRRPAHEGAQRSAVSV